MNLRKRLLRGRDTTAPCYYRHQARVASLGKGSYDDTNGTVHLTHSASLATATATESSESLLSLGKDKVHSFWSTDSLNETIELWQLESVEQERLKELGKRLEDIQYWKNTPDEAIRFLRAKSGDVHAAEQMFRASIDWRLKERADDALKSPPSQELIDAIPGSIIKGTDREGDPVFVSRLGAFDVVGAYKRFGREAIVRHAIWIRELAGRGEWRAKREAVMGRPMKHILIIEDLKGVPLSKVISSPQLLSMYGELMRIDQENYPDASKKIIIINTPTLFRMGWKVFKPFFHKYVVEKMVFCGSNDYEEVLSEYVDLSVLPLDLVPGIGQGVAETGMPSRFDGGNIISL